MVQAGSKPFYAALTELLEGEAAWLAQHLWSERGFNADDMKKVRKWRSAGYRKFLAILTKFRELPQRDGPPSVGEAEEEIQMRLGLWFCSYFLGFPLPHVWERVRHLESMEEGYSGSGALYDKLAGDIYRAGRKIRERHGRHRETARPGPEEPILVLAFSPTLLIADEKMK